jgi:phospholipid/cholesterol/gamma-HCH transport system substrate-binding protein
MKRRDEVLVGVVITVALVMGFLGALWLARGGLAPGYPMYAKFPWGAGLRQGQPVLLAGVTVGYVDKVDIKNEGFLLVAMRVRNEYKIPKGTTAKIEPNGFFGDMLVALYPDKPTTNYFAVGDTIPAGKASPSVGAVLARIDTLGQHLTIISGAFKKEFVDENGLREMRTTLASANRMIASLQKVAEEQNAELTKTQAAFRKATSAVDSAQIASTIASIKDAAASFEELTATFKASAKGLDSMVTRATTGNGSMAKLINDPAMYSAFLSATTRLDSLMSEFQRNPRKFIKLSIF